MFTYQFSPSINPSWIAHPECVAKEDVRIGQSRFITHSACSESAGCTEGEGAFVKAGGLTRLMNITTNPYCLWPRILIQRFVPGIPVERPVVLYRSYSQIVTASPEQYIPSCLEENIRTRHLILTRPSISKECSKRDASMSYSMRKRLCPKDGKEYHPMASHR